MLIDECKKLEAEVALTFNFDLFGSQSAAQGKALKLCAGAQVTSEVAQKVAAAVNDFFLTPEVVGISDPTLVAAAIAYVWQTGHQDDPQLTTLVTSRVSPEVVRTAFVLSQVYKTARMSPEEIMEAAGKRFFRTRGVSLTAFLLEGEVRKNLGYLIRNRGEKASGRQPQRPFRRRCHAGAQRPGQGPERTPGPGWPQGKGSPSERQSVRPGQPAQWG